VLGHRWLRSQNCARGVSAASLIHHIYLKIHNLVD